MDYRIFDVRTDVNACNCTQRFMDTVRESALKLDSGRKIRCRTRESNMYQSHASQTLGLLNYIPTMFPGSFKGDPKRGGSTGPIDRRGIKKKDRHTAVFQSIYDPLS